MSMWRKSSSDARVITSTMAMYAAMIPTLIMAWQQPVGQDPWVWGTSAVGCLFNYIGGEKTIAGRFMPFWGTIFNGAMTVIILRPLF